MPRVKLVQSLPKLERKVRVAAYARVSSDKDTMLHSLSNQVSYYNKYIQSKPGWELIGVYADEGLTGTKDNRQEFVRLVNDAKAGKIDLIITKAISRFARNTLTLLQTARELKARGVDIFFEEQNLHTISNEGEMVLTLLASMAQEESRQVSENQKWRIKHDFERGIAWGGKHCFGYRFIDKQYVVVPEEAEVVREIFRLYLEGNGYCAIAKILNEEGKLTYHGLQWGYNAVSAILSNINYTGHLLLQKTFRENHLTKKTKRNRGEYQQYFIEDDHEAIIPVEVFDEVARRRAIKREIYASADGGKHKGYPLTGMLVCGGCGKNYRHRTTSGRPYWICSTFNTRGKAYCAAKQIPERALYSALNLAMGYSEFNEADFKSKVKRIVVKAGNVLTLQFVDGTEKDVVWQDPTRSESWTDEMKEQARQHALKRYGKGEVQ